MTEINCEETKRQVHEFVQEELTESETELILAHIAHCDSCEADYDFEFAFNKVIKQSCDEAPPQELADRILKRIRNINSGHEKH
jgi:anti-sigma factor (TIGR02949 family)